jgi:hypothetical protein
MSIAANILRELKLDAARMREANAQSVGYMDETPYAETWYFTDKSAIEYDWQNGTFTEITGSN